MERRASDVLGVDPERFVELGVFNGFANLDSALHVHPHLLAASSAPEIRRSYDRFRTYFANVLKIIKAANRVGGRARRAAVSALTFKEIHGVGLGYTVHGGDGNAIGPVLAENLTQTASEIIAAGIEDPELFELMGLLEPGIGADRISDMTISVILPNLAEYNQRLAAELEVETTEIRIGGTPYRVPLNPESGSHIFLLSRDILRDLPIALSWDQIDAVTGYNEDLRGRLNAIIGNSWNAEQRRITKRDISEILRIAPSLLGQLIDQYKAHPRVPYNFIDDPGAEERRYLEATALAIEHPLTLATSADPTDEEMIAVVLRICGRFKRLVEDGRANELLHDLVGKPLKERAAQRLFFAVADAYCDANNLDLSPEVNSGMGPVDFKVSRGYAQRVLVEVKKSDNTSLVSGFLKQLPIYSRAEQATNSVYLVLRVNDSPGPIRRLMEAHAAAVVRRQRVPAIVIVDARLRPSASHS